MARVASPPRIVARVLTAANVLIGKTKDDKTGGKTQAEPWQVEALRYYDQVGELRYAAEFYAILGRVDYYVAILGQDGDPVPILDERSGIDADTAGRIVDVWDRVQDPGGGRAQLGGQYGRLRFLIGECYLTCSWEAGPEEIPGVAGELVEAWEMLSPDELTIKRDLGEVYRQRTDRSDSKTVYTILQAGETPEAGSILVWRLWKRHPRRSGLADSAVRSVLELLEELVLLRRAIRGRARSRIADAGLLMLPEQMFLEAEQEPGADDDPMDDPLMARIIEAAVTPLRDEGTAASVVPAMVRMDADMIEKVKLLRFRDSAETYPEIQLRQDCVTAIARGLPLPAEVITGLADVNHWGQWFISDQTWKHLEPDAVDLCREFTDAYLQPALRQDGVTDEAEYFIWFDPTNVVIRPDRARDAKDLFDRWELKGATMRNVSGFDDADAPDADEIAMRVQIQQAIRVRESIQETSLPTVESSGDVTQAPPNDNTPPVAASGSLPGLAWLNGGVDLAVLRCHEIAGGRLRSALAKEKRDRDYADVPNHMLASALGHDHVIALTGNPNPEAALVRNGSATLVAALRRHGATDVAAEMLAETVELEAARRLYDDE